MNRLVGQVISQERSDDEDRPVRVTVGIEGNQQVEMLCDHNVAASFLPGVNVSIEVRSVDG